MKITILGSSSAGNCYILHNEKEALIIEAGIKFSEVKIALDFKIDKIVGLLCSHEHGDHAGHLMDFLHAGIPVCASFGTLKAKSINTNVIKPTDAEKTAKFGGFSVMPFAVMHDCAEPYGFLINHEETGNMMFVTDTADVMYEFPGLHNIMIEANYSDDIVYQNIYDGKLNAKHQERVMKSHLSLERCEKFLRANDLRTVNNIILIHLSPGNSNAVQFRERISRATGKNVIIAEKKMTFELNKTPF